MVKQTKTLEEQDTPKSYKPTTRESDIQKFIRKRITEMKNFRTTLGVEREWRAADREYIPLEISFGSTRVRFEQNQDTGLRSKMVKVGDDSEDWRSIASEPTLLRKIQTALSIIIDRNPEAVMTAMLKRYEKTTALANALWKRNWEITNAKEVYKLFAFNLFKYGWAVGRIFPKIVKYDKQVLVEVDTDNPENNVYEDKEIIYFNDVARENLDPYRTWIDETSRPYDPYSMKEVYYEVDYTWDSFKAEFKQFPNIKNVSKLNAQVIPELQEKERTQREQEKFKRDDIVTVGFYENRLKDLYVIYIPAQTVILFESPLPNDDGMLSIFHGLYNLRSAENPYGFSIWNIIRQKKELYDKMNNMTMDQLVLSIMKMGFYTGTSNFSKDGKIKIKPGVLEQIIDGKIEWLDIPPPNEMSWIGLEHLDKGMDDDSGISPTLEGEITTGTQTLGEILHAKEGSLRRMKIPLENIAEAIEWDAYITFSWMSQVYATPEIQSFTDIQKLRDYEQENQIKANQVFGSKNIEGQIEGEVKATFLPQLALHLEDRDGQLFESKDSQFFQVGNEIKVDDLKWKGIFKVTPKSILTPSAELEKQRKLELYNIIVPSLQLPPELYLKPTIQILKVNEEDPRDWLPDSWLQLEEQQEELFVPNQNTPQGVAQAATQGIQGGGQTMQGQTGITPQKGQTVVPRGQTGMPQGQSPKNLFKGLLRQ